MKYEFRDDIFTRIPTALLVEDIQALVRAACEQDTESVWATVECLCEALETYTEVPDDLFIKPSASSIVACGVKPGILVTEGRDLKCAMDTPVSFAMDGGCCQCADNCLYMRQGKCDPDKGRVMLKGEFLYDGTSSNAERLMEFLEQGN